MCKLISIIVVCIVSFLTITGCGIKGPLYQTPSEKVEPNTAKKVNNSLTNQLNLNNSASR